MEIVSTSLFTCHSIVFIFTDKDNGFVQLNYQAPAITLQFVFLHCFIYEASFIIKDCQPVLSNLTFEDSFKIIFTRNVWKVRIKITVVLQNKDSLSFRFKLKSGTISESMMKGWVKKMGLGINTSLQKYKCISLISAISF